MGALEELGQAVVEGNSRRAEALTREALAQGAAPSAVFGGALIPAMDIVGQKMRANEYFIPEVLIAARAMKASLAVLEPLLVSDVGHRSSGTVVLGTVAGDMHDIGKNLVGLMLRGAGFDVVDLGTDVKADQFVAAVRGHGARVVGMSALLTTTMLHMKDVLHALREAGLREQVKVMIGGAPVTQRFADEVGADGYAPDSAGAVELARKWAETSSG